MTAREVVDLANLRIAPWNVDGAEESCVCEGAQRHPLDPHVWIVGTNIYRQGVRAKIDGMGFVFVDERTRQLVRDPSVVAREAGSRSGG